MSQLKAFNHSVVQEILFYHVTPRFITMFAKVPHESYSEPIYSTLPLYTLFLNTFFSIIPSAKPRSTNEALTLELTY